MKVKRLEGKAIKISKLSRFFLLIFFLILGCSHDKSTEPKNVDSYIEPPFRIVGYLPEYRVSSTSTEIGTSLTDLIFFSIEPTATGGLNTANFTTDVKNKLDLIRQNSHVKIHIAVGGWGRSDGFAEMAQNDVKRKTFITQLYQFCKSYNFDGVDYDWEFPANAAENDAYTDLIVDTKKQLVKDSLTVSVALNPYQTVSARAYDSLDRIHIMAYDEGGRHSTYESALAAVKHFTDQNVPTEKLYLGVPFYGRGINDRNLTMTYNELTQQYNLLPAMDEVDGIYFNGKNTIQKKTTYAMENDLGGVMIWEVGQDAQGNLSLLNAINELVK